MVGAPPRPHHEPRDYNSLLPAIMATVVLCSIMTSVLVGLRLATKYFSSKYDCDDFILLVAWVSNLGFEFCLLAGGLNGMDHHVWRYRETHFIELNKYGWALEILYILTIWLAKAALLFQLIRTFARFKSGPGYWTCHCFIWFNLAFYFSMLLAIVFECRPIWKIENAPHHGYCCHLKRLLVAFSAINVLSDLLILLLSTWATWQLQMSAKKKAGVMGIFTVGLLAFIFSICRLVYTTRITTKDGGLYGIAQTSLWGVAETATIILCICLPTMPSFIKLIRDRSSSSSTPQPTSSLTAIKQKVRKSTIFLVGHLHSSIGTGSMTNPLPSSSSPAHPHSQEVDTIWIKSPYSRLSEEENNGKSGGRESVVRDLGSKRMVEIEMASRDQLNAKSRVVSMV